MYSNNEGFITKPTYINPPMPPLTEKVHLGGREDIEISERSFKCIKEFALDKYEGDAPIENEQFVIPMGSIWELSEHSHMSDIRMEGELGWVEIDSESLKAHFIEI